ncbi:MAG TPA: cytochrome c peroxidase [Pirellulales bacterium]|jgi:cytochrome c peroxidase|nr:cytochrome c peroxidase [Pirellulales bacterium]
MIRDRIAGLGFVLVCAAALAGCEMKTAEAPKVAANTATPSKELVPEPMAPPASQAGSEAMPPAKEPLPSQKTEKVKLPDPSLTAGIPGSGELTLDDIKKWIDDPKNHATLEVELPLGLAAGQKDIKGLDKNPLTRAKIELGRQLYFDPRLSKDGTVSCASCHSPDEGFAAHTQFGIGVDQQQGGRNSPVSYNRILSDLQFWDGRASSLEDQAKGPIANPIEMANTHEECVKCITQIEGYKLQFAEIFGDLKIDHIADAIASFERVLVTGPSPFDYAEQMRAFEGMDPNDLKADDLELYKVYQQAKSGADAHPMSEAAKKGRNIFFGEKGSCTACHVGPNLTDEKYHNIGVGMAAEKPDLGRYVVSNDEKDKGAFKTPTIRNVALSAPYMHDGATKTLKEVVAFYAKGGEPNPHLDPKIKKLQLNEEEQAELVAFMEACTGDFPKVEKDRLPK